MPREKPRQARSWLTRSVFVYLTFFDFVGIHNYCPRHLDKAFEFLSQTAEKFPYEKLFDPKVYLLEDISSAIAAAKTQTYHRVLVKPKDS